MPSQKKIIENASNTEIFLRDSNLAAQKTMQRSINTLERRIIAQVKQLQTTDTGLLMGARVNLKQTQKIHARLNQIFEETYDTAAAKVVNGYDRSARWINKSFKELDIAATFTSVDADIINTLKNQDMQTFIEFGADIQEKIANSLYDSVVLQQPFDEMVLRVQGILQKGGVNTGMSLAALASLHANDAIMNFHNSVALKKAQDARLNNFLYLGNIMASSRQFCLTRVARTYTRKQIQSWTFNWQGKSGPAMTHRGGYNCRHHWQPVKKAWVKSFDRNTGRKIQQRSETYIRAMEATGIRQGTKGSRLLFQLLDEKVDPKLITKMPWNKAKNPFKDVIADLKEKNLLGVDKSGDIFLKTKFVPKPEDALKTKRKPPRSRKP